ncbi:MAG: peptidoglycan-associated lipoprotein Pal [Acidimicrobiales bacterium]|nr:peptidoglycan-associated lipoprotein Pal [Hyphomonadaceae bacterium]RZV39833.1 MAG: peptidoglycan-associated lipoprotein Pal [Acidimicrobiales bacterium]
MKTRYILLGSIALTLSACASTPEVEEVVETEPVQQELPPPVVEPAPEPVVQAPPVVQEVYTGPPPGTAEHFKYVSGDDRVYFGYDRYDLSSQARDVLRKQSEWLNQYGQAIVVVGGNCDERGTREYNLALGARRADAVKAFLVSQGVNPSRITTVSYGKERPIAGESNEAAWALNRNAHSSVMVGGNTRS